MKSYLKTRDFSVSGEEFELFLDEDLDLLVTQPQPPHLDKYYQSEGYISHTDSKKSVIDRIYHWVKRYSLQRKMALIKSFSSEKKTLLDIGSGTGDFLVAAKKGNWSVLGIEPNKGARTLAIEKGVPIKDSLETITGSKFDVITLWHVLEHLPRLEDQINEMILLLKDKGILVIAVPNFKSFDAQFYGKFWAAYDVPRHLWHFSRDSMAQLFSKWEVKPITIKPMFFDAFYVALLSEKYKTGKNNYLKSFCVGLWSNIKAMFSGEYSSLIYVFQKL